MRNSHPSQPRPRRLPDASITTKVEFVLPAQVSLRDFADSLRKQGVPANDIVRAVEVQKARRADENVLPVMRQRVGLHLA